MIWQFTGVGPHNKGAELMFLAMRDKVLEIDPEARIAMLPGTVGDYEWRSRQGLWQVLDPQQSGRLGWLRDRLLHGGYRERFGIVHQREVEVVLDASGFALGDQWKAEWIDGTATYYERLRRQGTKIILLPQAMGPFEKPAVRDAARRVLNAADLVFARDSESLEYAGALCEAKRAGEKIRLAPDFTNLLKGRLPQGWQPRPDQQVAIIPNRQMLENGGDGFHEHYIQSMASAMTRAQHDGLDPFVLIHEVHDRELGEKIASQADLPDAVEQFNDPLELKGILGQCAYSVGSRFHGLINCLSQGVPAVGTSWSHKYRHLFDDYSAAELLVRDASDFDRGMSLLGTADDRAVVAENVREAAGPLRSRAEQMWQQVSVELSS